MCNFISANMIKCYSTALPTLPFNVRKQQKCNTNIRLGFTQQFFGMDNLFPWLWLGHVTSIPTKFYAPADVYLQ